MHRAVVGGLTSSAVSTTTVTVSSSAVSGASNYTVDYKPASSGTWINAATATTALSVNLSGLAGGSLYDWRVKANCTVEGPYSQAQFTTSASSCPGPYDVSTNGIIAGAASIPLNTDVKGLINPRNDNDYFKFDITTGGTITISLTTLPADYQLALLNNSGTILQSSVKSGTANESISQTVTAGSYYAAFGCRFVLCGKLNDQIFKFSHDGKLLMKLGVARVPGNDSLHFNLPTDIAVADNGTFYVSDGYSNTRVVKFSSTGKYIKAWGTYGNKPGEFMIPHGIAIDQNNTIYVADRQNNRIQLFDTSGNFLKELKNDVQVEQFPSIAIDKADHLFAIDYDPTKKMDSTANGSTIFEFDLSQNTQNHFGATGSANRTTSWFHDIAIDSKGNIYVGDITSLKVLKFKAKKSS